jgi:hypothetical protein
MPDTLSMYDLVEKGVFIEAGLDEFGEQTYTIDLERAKHDAPEVYDIAYRRMAQNILDAVDEGYIEVDFDTDLNVDYPLTDKGMALLAE